MFNRLKDFKTNQKPKQRITRLKFEKKPKEELIELMKVDEEGEEEKEDDDDDESSNSESEFDGKYEKQFPRGYVYLTL